MSYYGNWDRSYYGPTAGIARNQYSQMQYDPQEAVGRKLAELYAKLPNLSPTQIRSRITELQGQVTKPKVRAFLEIAKRLIDQHPTTTTAYGNDLQTNDLVKNFLLGQLIASALSTFLG